MRRRGSAQHRMSTLSPHPTVQCGPPPTVSNARAFGKPKQRYEIGSITRYHCRHGFAPRRSPIIRCREDGIWERPQLSCRPGERAAPCTPTPLLVDGSSLGLFASCVPPGLARHPED